MSPITCPCGNTNGPFVRIDGRHLCENCADKQQKGGSK